MFSTLADALLPIQAAMRRCILNDAGEVQYYLGATDSTKREDGVLASVLDGTDGQVMTQIPNFITSTAIPEQLTLGEFP
jgi:hypothetical protein